MEPIQDLDKIILLLKKEVKNFENPLITKIDEVSKTPFMVLVSCLLSLRTQDRTTGPVARKLFFAVKTPQDINKLSLKKLEDIIRPVNYYKTKASRIKEISKTLIKEYEGQVPNSFDELLKLKGVGKKTAAITMLFGHHDPNFIAVDIHVHMIANRLGWVKTKNAEQTMDELMKVLPKKYWHDLNELFVLHGQNICFKNYPICSRCAIKEYCPRIGVIKSR